MLGVARSGAHGRTENTSIAARERNATQQNSGAFAPLPQRGRGDARLVSLSNQSLSKGVGGEGHQRHPKDSSVASSANTLSAHAEGGYRLSAIGYRLSAISYQLSPLALLLLYGLVWFIGYRMAWPFYPYPLRSLPLWVVGGLGAWLLVRSGPPLVAHQRWLVGAPAAGLLIGLWSLLIMVKAQAHVTLSRPGVENDFRAFAARDTLPLIFSADGFYNLGYPLLLWLVRPWLADNPFLAGRLLAALSGALFLAGSYWLARSLLPRGPALLALLMLALSGFVAQYGLYVGSDMPFAAAMIWCVAALVAALHAPLGSRRAWLLAGGAGLCGGLAFLMRHPGLLLLPWGLLLLWGTQRGRKSLAAYTLAFVLAIMPQLSVNLIQTGQPLYSQQAKNIWLAVYGNTDWSRWDEVPDTIGLGEVVLRDPARFIQNWGRNLVAFVGSGAEDTSEFGRAIQLRMLGFPANWLALAGMLAWLGLIPLQIADCRLQIADCRLQIGTHGVPMDSGAPDDTTEKGLTGPPTTSLVALVSLVALYVAAVSSGFILPRFFLPLSAIYAVAGAWLIWRILPSGAERMLTGIGVALLVVLWNGFHTGAAVVLQNQPPDEVAAVAMVHAVAPHATLAAYLPARVPLANFSAIAHQVVAWPAGVMDGHTLTPADLAAVRQHGATYLLWDEARGTPPLPDPEAARVATSGRYALYRL
ncbi:hypothetical protein CJ255_03950 [Candidatus Viridilinea mediisalina]|uniref:Glycosyltransferase RgtA/B/C/D-like domain-containing protein n=2 Tax=Candidatus Viridilinea mediisalina TaxID=2024553 RepID=A0A2A6RN67_9CHLR|nr:hypothetical protein CJ255_03950 [Candidatus Viridilinea mediisalina]